MTYVGVHQAKTHLSRLLGRVEAGETVIIRRNGKAVARIVPFPAPRRARRLGTGRGRIRLAKNWNAPLPASVIRSFER